MLSKVSDIHCWVLDGIPVGYCIFKSSHIVTYMLGFPYPLKTVSNFKGVCLPHSSLDFQSPTVF